MAGSKARPRPHRGWPPGVVALGIVALYGAPVLFIWLWWRFFLRSVHLCSVVTQEAAHCRYGNNSPCRRPLGVNEFSGRERCA